MLGGGIVPVDRRPEKSVFRSGAHLSAERKLHGGIKNRNKWAEEIAGFIVINEKKEEKEGFI